MNVNDINKLLNGDDNLREAIRRRERKSLSMPANLNDRLLQRIKQQDKKSKHIRIKLYSAISGVAAGFLLLLILYNHSNDVHQGNQGVVAKQTLQEDSISKGEKNTSVEYAPVLAQTTSITSPTKNKRKISKVVRQRTKETATTHAANAPVRKNKQVVQQSKLQSQPKSEDDKLQYTAETSSQMAVTTMRVIHIAPNHIVYVNETVNPIPFTDVPSVNELRMRGQRLTTEVIRHIQEPIEF